MIKNITIPDLFERTDCSELSNEQIAELHREAILIELNKYNCKAIAINTHIFILTEE